MRFAKYSLIAIGVLGILGALGFDLLGIHPGSGLGPVQLTGIALGAGCILVGLLVPPVYAHRAGLAQRWQVWSASPWIHAVAAGVLILAGLATFRVTPFFLPFDWDNMFSYTVVQTRSALDFFTTGVGGESTYRPLGMLTIWLQGQFVGLDAAPYFWFNQLLWIGCSLALYAWVCVLTRSRLAALIVSLAFLVEKRSTSLVLLIDDRQSSQSLFFGLLAMLVLALPWGKTRRPLVWVALFLLLLASALSKEYGLAFSGAVVVYALVGNLEGRARKTEGSPFHLAPQGRQDALFLSSVAIAVVGVYALLRILAAGGAVTSDFCQEMSLFPLRIDQQVCLSQMDTPTKIAQFGYNIGSTFVGILVPWALTWTGGPQVPQLDAYVLLVQLPLLALAVWALFKFPRQALPAFSLVVFNALLSFLIYRGRNQVIGAAGMYVCAGLGLAAVLRLAAQSARYKFVAAAAAVVLLVGVGVQSILLTNALESERVKVASSDICSLSHYAFMTPALIYEVKVFYGQSNPSCAVP